MPQATLRINVDGREETISEYICDWPDCPASVSAAPASDPQRDNEGHLDHRHGNGRSVKERRRRDPSATSCRQVKSLRPGSSRRGAAYCGRAAA